MSSRVDAVSVYAAQEASRMHAAEDGLRPCNLSSVAPQNIAEDLGTQLPPAQLETDSRFETSSKCAVGIPTHYSWTPQASQGAYSSREAYLQGLEANGEISFVYIVNDGSDQNNAWCVKYNLGLFSRTSHSEMQAETYQLLASAGSPA